MITVNSLPGGTVGDTYDQTLTADGTKPITWSIDSDVLPDGLSLDSTTGAISGTPEESGTFYFEVKASGPFGDVTKELSITIVTAYNPPPYTPPTPPSSETTPTAIVTTIDGTPYEGELQSDSKTYLITLPPRTDVTGLLLSIGLPAGASISPSIAGKTFDFSGGPLEFTITAQDGATKRDIAIDVRVESPVPVEQAWFSGTAADCEIAYETNEGEPVAARLRIPFAPSSDPARIDVLSAAITGVAVANVSYGYRDAGGDFHPIESDVKTPAARAPYLQIAFTVQSVSALRYGGLERIAYWLKGSETEYVQTYSPPLAFAGMTFTDETPPKPVDPEEPPDDSEEPPVGDNPANGGGGCSAGLAGFAGLAALAFVPLRRRSASEK
jgi:hypothetical protein